MKVWWISLNCEYIKVLDWILASKFGKSSTKLNLPDFSGVLVATRLTTDGVRTSKCLMHMN